MSMTMTDYIRKFYKENPEELGKKSNKKFYDQYLQDHPRTASVPGNVLGSLGNMKSRLRKEQLLETFSVSDQASSMEEVLDLLLMEARKNKGENWEKVTENIRQARNRIVQMNPID